MQATGSKGQMYTKVAEAVDFMASAGMEVNCSIMAEGCGYRKNADGTYDLVYSNVTGMDHEKAFALSKKHNNVQPILVGMNDTHIALAMADENVTFIIPWHSSGNSGALLSELVGAATLNKETLSDSSDYTKLQSDVRLTEEQGATAEQLLRRDMRDRIVKGDIAHNRDSLSAADRALL